MMGSLAPCGRRTPWSTETSFLLSLRGVLCPPYCCGCAWALRRLRLSRGRSSPLFGNGVDLPRPQRETGGPLDRRSGAAVVDRGPRDQGDRRSSPESRFLPLGGRV